MATYLLIFLIFYWIYKFIIYVNKTEGKTSHNLEHEKINLQVAQGVPNHIEKIVAIDINEKASEIALVKIDDKYKIYIEIINSHSDRIIHLSEYIYYQKTLLYYFNDYPFPIIFDPNLDGKDFSRILNFKFFESIFYLNIKTTTKENTYRWNLKINSSGTVIEKSTDSLDEFYSEQGNSLTFFDSKNFKELDLTEVFNNFFKKDQSCYNLFIKGYYSVALSPNKEKIAIEFLFVNDSTHQFLIFDISNFEIPKLISLNYFYESLDRFKFSKDNKKIIYSKRDTNDDSIIHYFVREIKTGTLGKSEKFSIEHEYRVFSYDFELVNNAILEIESFCFNLHNLIAKETYFIPRNNHSPYCLNNNELIYINNYNLEKIIFE
jgi:hypothetical protein